MEAEGLPEAAPAASETTEYKSIPINESQCKSMQILANQCKSKQPESVRLIFIGKIFKGLQTNVKHLLKSAKRFKHICKQLTNNFQKIFGHLQKSPKYYKGARNMKENKVEGPRRFIIHSWVGARPDPRPFCPILPDLHFVNSSTQPCGGRGAPNSRPRLGRLCS